MWLFTVKMDAMYKATLCGHYWIIGSGNLDSLLDLVYISLITKTTWRDIQNILLNGLRISWNQLNEKHGLYVMGNWE